MLELRKIYKNYQVDNKPYPALKEINLSFADQGFVSILGPSGCGKTTLLNLIGGLDQYTKGDLLINGKSTKKFTDRDWDAYRNKRVGFVFQNYNLVPHLTILANVELSLTLSGIAHKKRLKLAANALAKVGLKNALKKKPNQLSGGQMQRVAIARALVNNPEIILADEPTGALDSVTSIQVLNLLKKVAKNRLVIMVTHNEELAERYSTRIIKLRDGRIINDSKPIKLKIIEEDAPVEQEKNKQTHMSFFTALGNSFRNLLTKKGRTIMTAVAASFGVIGVALVLAMSNGFSNYVGRVEMATASSVPITISPFVTSAIKETSLPEAWPSEPVIKPYEEDISQLVQLHHNQITKEYANYCRDMLKEPHHYASSVLENHEYLDFNIFTERANTSGGTDIIKVDQFKSAGATGTILSGTTDLPSTIFHELYGDKNYISSNYDVIFGQYPRETMYKDNQGNLHCDVCLVCDRYNRIPIKTLYELGLSPSDITTSGATISFNNLVGHRYKSFMPNDVYSLGKVESEEIDVRKISSTDVWTLDENVTKQKFTQFKDITSPFHKEELKTLYNNDAKAITMEITGILRLKKDSLINLMPGSICYPTALKDYYVDKIKDPIFDEYRNVARNNWYIPVAKNEKEEDITQEKWSEFLLIYFYGLNTQSTTSISTLLENPAASPIIFLNILANPDINDTFHYTMPLVDSNQYRTFQRNNYRFANEFKTPKFIEDTSTGQKIIISIDPTSIDSFIDPVTYINGYSTITSLLIFPRNLSAKQQVFQYLNQWNVGKPVSQQIQYADLAGTLTNALGTLIDVISIVLICFSAVSLLVACVMTGVITYTSVLERTKEIGILRAIGARKKDVGRLFEAESVIVGAIGGLIGIVFTFIIEGPVSLVINARFPEQKIGLICNLNPLHALLLVLVSVLLTFVAGFIPARKAAKKDPVVALRTE